MTLETGSFTKPLAALDACLDDLVKSWGYDPAVLRQLTAPPKAVPPSKPADLCVKFDIPTMHEGKSGSVRFRFDVGADGAVVGCTVQSRQPVPGFGESICRQFTQTFRFEPARDASG